MSAGNGHDAHGVWRGAAGRPPPPPRPAGSDPDLDAAKADPALLRGIVGNVKWEKDGKRWKCCCPFHAEKSASFIVFPDGGFKCFGCDAQGSIVDFIMRKDGVSTREAIERAKAAAGRITTTAPKREAGPRKRNGEAEELFAAIIPPPKDAPKPDLSDCTPAEYVGTDGRLLFYQRRFDRPGRKKTFGQLTYGTLTKRGRPVTGWHAKGPPPPHPLYRLDRLAAADPETLVIVVEGEKACEAAERLFPDAIVVTWLNGADSVHLADWTPLRRFRRVVWWADADRPKERPHGCFLATPAFRALFPNASYVDTAGLAEIEDGFDAADLEELDEDDPKVWLEARLRQWEQPKPARILSGADFMASFVPPDWLIEGIIQRSRLYACTSLTGHGKTAVWLYLACMVQAGRLVGDKLDVTQGNVLILAGENPEDLKARMHGMAADFKLRPEQMPYVLPGNFPMNDEEAERLLRDIAGLGVPFVLIVGDTASSFFPGDDENDNVQAGGYARTLRRLTLECPGDPAVVTLCHPVKNASKGNLLPRGGGAFLNELDGNPTLWSEAMGELTELHWQGKIRGPDFSPLGFRLRPVPTGFLDRKNQPVMTIVAEPMSEESVADHKKQAIANEDAVLLALSNHPEASWTEIARHAGWLDDGGQPMKPRVQRTIKALAEGKLVEQERRGAPWTLTEKGRKAVQKRYPKVEP